MKDNYNKEKDYYQNELKRIEEILNLIKETDIGYANQTIAPKVLELDHAIEQLKEKISLCDEKNWRQFSQAFIIDLNKINVNTAHLQHDLYHVFLKDLDDFKKDLKKWREKLNLDKTLGQDIRNMQDDMRPLIFYMGILKKNIFKNGDNNAFSKIKIGNVYEKIENEIKQYSRKIEAMKGKMTEKEWLCIDTKDSSVKEEEIKSNKEKNLKQLKKCCARLFFCFRSYSPSEEECQKLINRIGFP